MIVWHAFVVVAYLLMCLATFVGLFLWLGLLARDVLRGRFGE